MVNMWVMSYVGEVSLRSEPGKHSKVLKTLKDGDTVIATGERMGRWLQCAMPCEQINGWIREDFLTNAEQKMFSEPKIFVVKRQTISRYSINGAYWKGLNPGEKVKAYMSDSYWVVTNKGLVRKDCVEECKA